MLAVLALAGSLWPVHALNLSALLALGRSDLFLRAEIAKKAVAIVAILCAAPFGGLAMAWAILGASVYAAVVNCHYSGKLLGYGLGRQIADLWPVVALTAAMACVVLAPGRIDAGQGMRLGAMVLAGAATYAGGALALRLPALGHIRSMFASMRQDAGRPDAFDDQ
jgi:O-antigen/teichoic acid export membrane protein